MTNDEALLAALANLPPLPVYNPEYRIYYDEITRDCTQATTEDLPGQPYVIVTREEYEAVQYQVLRCHIKDGHPVAKPLDHTTGILLSLQSTGQPTVKDCNIFVADHTTTAIDYWAAKE